MKITLHIFLGILFFCSFQIIQIDPLQNLYERYKLGEISECQINGATVYLASINAYDAPVVVYDELGEKLFTCNYAWGQADETCSELTLCETIYRCQLHVSGKRAIDKYDLSR